MFRGQGGQGDGHFTRWKQNNFYNLHFLLLFLFLGMSLSAGSSPLHSPKITPHTSPAPRRRSHTPNPANYMVPTTASDQGAHIIQKETVGGTTYFYTDNTPAPMTGMVRVFAYLARRTMTRILYVCHAAMC